MLKVIADASLKDISVLVHQLVKSGETEIVIQAPLGGWLFHNLQDFFDFEILQSMSQSCKWNVTFETDLLLLAEIARAFGFEANVADSEGQAESEEPDPQVLWPCDNIEFLRTAALSPAGFFPIEVGLDFTSAAVLAETLREKQASGIKDFLLKVKPDSRLFSCWDDFILMQDYAEKYGLNIRFESFMPTFVLMANTAGFYVSQNPRLQSATLGELKCYAKIMRESAYLPLQLLAEILEPTILLLEEGYIEEAERLLDDRAERYIFDFYAVPANRIHFGQDPIVMPEEGQHLLTEVNLFAQNHFDSRYRTAS